MAKIRFWKKEDSAIKVAVDSVINAMMKRPNDFTIDENTMTDTKTRYIYWISSGCASVWKPYKLEFGFSQGRRFHRALRDLKTYQLKTKTDRGSAGE